MLKIAGVLVLAAVFIVMLWKGTQPGGSDAAPVRAAITQNRPVPTSASQPPPGREKLRQSADTIEDKVRALSPSGTPEQYLDAYQKIQSCLELEREKALVIGVKPTSKKSGDGYEYDLGLQWANDDELKKMTKFCSTMTGRTRSDRYQLLQHAFNNRASGALTAYIMEGPNGERNALQERPTDPAVVEWRAATLQRLETDIDAGYTDAISFSLNGFVSLGRVNAEDLYLSHLINNMVTSAVNSGQALYDQKFMDAWSASLTQQQKNEAELHASRIFIAWKRRNNRK